MNRIKSLKPPIFFSFLAVIGTLLIGTFIILTVSSKRNRLSSIHNEKGYFIPLPIVKFTRSGIPCLAVEIENKKMTMELDLGFRGQLVFSNSFVQSLNKKKRYGSKKMYGIRGKADERPLYQVPEVIIEHISFPSLILQEEVKSMALEASFVKENETRGPQEVGRIGWELFKDKKLFIDLSNSLIALCSSAEVLDSQKCPIDTFIKAPLLTERGLLEFYADTPQGPLRCMLDTGSSVNILNSELKDGQSLEKAIWDPENELTYDTFCIEGCNFGETYFLKIPIRIPIHIEAILGVDFFLENLVYIDFSKNEIFFRKKSIAS